jgi:hypothetical protein
LEFIFTTFCFTPGQLSDDSVSREATQSLRTAPNTLGTYIPSQYEDLTDDSVKCGISKTPNSSKGCEAIWWLCFNRNHKQPHPPSQYENQTNAINR